MGGKKTYQRREKKKWEHYFFMPSALSAAFTEFYRRWSKTARQLFFKNNVKQLGFSLTAPFTTVNVK